MDAGCSAGPCALAAAGASCAIAATGNMTRLKNAAELKALAAVNRVDFMDPCSLTCPKGVQLRTCHKCCTCSAPSASPRGGNRVAAQKRDISDTVSLKIRTK